MITVQGLLLEDNLSEAERIELMLRDSGINCNLLRVETRVSFIAALERNHFDFILAADALSEIDGFSALRIANTYCPEVPFIMISARLGEEFAIEALKSGATDYVLKQRLERLIPSVQQALQAAQARRELQDKSTLPSSAKDFDAMLDVIGMGKVQTDALTRRLLSVNAAFCAITGYSEAELLTLTVDDLHHPDDRAQDRERFLNLLQGKSTRYQSEKRYLRKDGSIRWVLAAGNIIRDATGRPLYTIAVVQDITERKQAEEALRVSEARLKAVAANLPNGAIFIVDRDLRYVMAEGKALENAGITSRDLVGKTLWEALPLDLASRYKPYFRQALRGEPFSWEHCSHDRYYISHGTPLYNDRDEVDAVLTVSYDISDRKRVELNAEFLATVSQSLIGVSQASEIVQTVGEQLNRYLKSSICAFVEINETADEAVIQHDWHQDNAPSLVGVYSLPEFVSAEFQQAAKARQTIVVHDVTADSRIVDPEKFAALKIGSFINVPIIKNNKWKFTLGVYHSTPYRWRSDEIELMRELASRIWNRIERVYAEDALRKSEAKYRMLFNSMDEGYVLVDVSFDESDRPIDVLFLDANPSVKRLTGLDLIGKRLREIDPNYESHWWETFGRVAQRGIGERQELYAEPLQSWYNFYVFKVGDADSCRVAAVFQDVTDRARIENERKKVEQEREQFLAVGSDLQVITSSTGYFQWVSPTFERTLGWTQEEIISRPWTEFVHPDDRERSISETQSLFSGCETFRFENRYRHKDGSYRWFLWNAKPYAEAQLIYGAAVDITDLKLAEESLRQSEERTRLALQAAQLGTWCYDLKSHRVELDERMREILGKSQDTATIDLSQFIEQIYPDDRAPVERAIEAALDPKSSGTYEMEYRILCEDQSERWICANGQAQFKEEGQSRRAFQLIGTALDITTAKHREAQRQQAEAALRESEKRFRTLADNISQLTWMADRNGWLFWYNRRWFEYTGTTLEEMQGWGWQKVHHPDHLDRVTEYFCRCLETGELWEDTFPLRGKDGTYRWFLSRAIPIRDESGQIFRWFGTNTDITERQQIEAERERLLQQEQAAREEAERASRIKDEFLAVLSHELRSPLNPILGWAKLLQSGKFDAARTKQALEIIERNAKQQTQLIDDLLDISRILRGKFALTEAPISLVPTIEAAQQTMKLSAEAKSIEVRTNLDSSLPPVLGDAGRLQQIIVNLLSNAVKFTPQGGQVEVKLERVGSEAQIQVKDTGKGIASDFLPYVFESFRQEDSKTTRRFGGLGLGLAIVRQITELHGGTVYAESPGEGQGATFTIRLPIINPEDLNDRRVFHADASSDEGNVLQGIRVLVVDDQADMRSLVATILEQSGAIVQIAASATEALAMFDQFQPRVLISDIGMPEIDGYEFIRQIRSRSPNLSRQLVAIALSAYAMEQDQQQALTAGYQRHLAKPIEPQMLIKAIAALLASQE